MKVTQGGKCLAIGGLQKIPRDVVLEVSSWAGPILCSALPAALVHGHCAPWVALPIRRLLKLRWALFNLSSGSVACPTSRKGTVMLCSGIEKVQKASVMSRWEGVKWKMI